MAQPQGFKVVRNEHMVCLLNKSLYGLKQSPRQWYKRFDNFMVHIGFKRSNYDNFFHFKILENGLKLFLLIYVDDMLLAC